MSSTKAVACTSRDIGGGGGIYVANILPPFAAAKLSFLNFLALNNTKVCQKIKIFRIYDNNDVLSTDRLHH